MAHRMGEIQRRPSSVDLHVGARIRMRRRVLGISQEALAEALRLTFQQVQKYERGANRVSASKLFAIANFLQVPVGYFFDGLDGSHGGAEEPEADSDINAFLATGEGLELARRFRRIPSSRVRRQVLELVRALTEEAAPEDANAVWADD